jgi:eukaryotic-like serine/threonine-protein kinase
MSGILQDGTLFAGRYRVVRPIAAGGMGAVYEVVHLETERRRALKVMHPHILQSADMHQRFKLEAKVAAHIESDFIVDVFDAGVDAATEMPFLVMELLRGEDLKNRLKRLGRLSPEEVVHHLHQAALALDKTHKASIVHRDLKPENLFLAEREDSPPRIKVLDFGVAKVLAESAALGATQSVGTPIYMAPEQFNPLLPMSSACDIYALAMIAYTLLVGAPYWMDEAKEGNIFRLTAAAMHGPQQPARQRAAAHGVALPPAFDAWFATATAARAEHRFPTATGAVSALAHLFGIPLPLVGRSSLVSGSSFSTREDAPVAPPRLAPAAFPGQPQAFAPPAPAAWNPAPAALASTPAVSPAPETTGLSAALTRPKAPPGSKSALILGGLALGALGIAGSIGYVVLAHPSSPSAAAPGDKSSAVVADQAPPTVAPALSVNVPEPAHTAEAAASVTPEPSSAPSTIVSAPAKLTAPAATTSGSARVIPVASPPKAAPRPKYTLE